MNKLREYLKEHRRDTIKGEFLALAIGWGGLFILEVSIGDTDNIFMGILCLMQFALNLYSTFFKTAGEAEPEYDPRPMDEKLREAFAGLTSEELQAILDDDLRSEETKAVARKLLEERKTEI